MDKHRSILRRGGSPIRVLSLGVRTFLFSFLPMCVALGASFLVIDAAIRAKIKESLKESLHRTEAVLDQVNAYHKSRTTRLVAVLSEQAELKAGLGLLREAPRNHQAGRQIRSTIEDQLRDLGHLLDYDLLIVADSGGAPIAAVAGAGRKSVEPDSLPASLGGSALLTVRGTLYEVLTVPVNLRGENLGTLSVGHQFDLASLRLAGDAALLHDRRILVATFPASLTPQIERQLQSRCPRLDDACQIEVAGHTYLALPVVPADFGPAYRVLSFQSLDATLERFTRGFPRVFVELGVGGVVVALLLSAVAVRLISKPLGDLIARLQHSEQTGRLPSDLSTHSSAREVNLVAEALNRASAAAEAASRAKNEFLSGMSHEIRTPMNGVTGMLEVLMSTSLTPEQRECGETIRSSAETLLHMIQSLLDFSGIEAGKMSLEVAPFDLRLLVDGVASLLATPAHAKGLDLRVHYDPGAPRRLRGDAGRLRQVLTNLAGNAVKFTPHGRVVIRLESEQQTPERARLRLSVEDTGIGIAEDKIERLFDKFSQADASTTRRYGGMGLGLAICRQLVERMGGQIGVRSRLGEGSTFWCALDLPLDQEAPPPPAPVPRIAAQVLVADDNPVNQRIAVRMLQRLGPEVDVAATGLEVLAMLERRSYDLVLMDCQMPEMDGYQATAEIRRRHVAGRRLPIVAMTANALAGDRDRCLAAGMDDYIAKPVTLADLRAALERWLPPRHDTMSG